MQIGNFERPFLRNHFYIPYATEGIIYWTVRQLIMQVFFGQRKFLETAQQNFIKLCSYEGHAL